MRTLVVICSLLLCYFPALAGTLDLQFLVARPNTDAVNIALVLGFKDPGGIVERRAAMFEANGSSFTFEEKLDVFRWYVGRLKFVKAEKLAEQLISETGGKDAKVLAGMGFVQICRGDYEKAGEFFLKAEKLGFRPALWFRLYLSDFIGRTDIDEKQVKEIISLGEINESEVAALGVIAYCRLVPNSEQMFKLFCERAKPSVFREEHVWYSFKQACEVYKQPQYKERVRQWREENKVPGK